MLYSDINFNNSDSNSEPLNFLLIYSFIKLIFHIPLSSLQFRPSGRGFCEGVARSAHPLGAAKRNRKPRRWAKFASEASEQRPSRGEAPRPDGWEAYERAKRANFPPIGARTYEVRGVAEHLGGVKRSRMSAVELNRFAVVFLNFLLPVYHTFLYILK